VERRGGKEVIKKEKRGEKRKGKRRGDRKERKKDKFAFVGLLGYYFCTIPAFLLRRRGRKKKKGGRMRRKGEREKKGGGGRGKKIRSMYNILISTGKKEKKKIRKGK